MKEHGGLPTLDMVTCLIPVSEALLGHEARPDCLLEAAESVTLANALWS